MVEELKAVNEIQEYRSLQTELIETLGGDLSDEELKQLEEKMFDSDQRNIGRLSALTLKYGWPSIERTGGSIKPLVFLLHMSPVDFDRLSDLMLCEVQSSRMAVNLYANAHDKAQVIRGEPLLYGVGRSFNPQTGQMNPPLIADQNATNSARITLGLDEIEQYRLVEQ